MTFDAGFECVQGSTPVRPSVVDARCSAKSPDFVGLKGSLQTSTLRNEKAQEIVLFLYSQFNQKNYICRVNLIRL